MMPMRSLRSAEGNQVDVDIEFQTFGHGFDGTKPTMSAARQGTGQSDHVTSDFYLSFFAKKEPNYKHSLGNKSETKQNYVIIDCRFN